MFQKLAYTKSFRFDEQKDVLCAEVRCICKCENNHRQMLLITSLDTNCNWMTEEQSWARGVINRTVEPKPRNCTIRNTQWIIHSAPTVSCLRWKNTSDALISTRFLFFLCSCLNGRDIQIKWHQGSLLIYPKLRDNLQHHIVDSMHKPRTFKNIKIFTFIFMKLKKKKYKKFIYEGIYFKLNCGLLIVWN